MMNRGRDRQIEGGEERKGGEGKRRGGRKEGRGEERKEVRRDERKGGEKRGGREEGMEDQEERISSQPSLPPPYSLSSLSACPP